MLLLDVTAYRYLPVEKYWYMEYNADYSEFVISFFYERGGLGLTRQEAFDEINSIQDSYVYELIGIINNPAYVMMKTIDFTSPTGTGKTKMMSKLINRFPDYYFIVTTLSKGQLHVQVRNSLMLDCKRSNFIVYGSADYKINSILQADDIISHIPENSRCIWLRDEGHIRTNRFEELLMDKCYKVINFSATNVRSDIKCNFTQTMMLRTVSQSAGTPEDAVLKLLEVKKLISRYLAIILVLFLDVLAVTIIFLIRLQVCVINMV